MLRFCAQCADDLGLPSGDLAGRCGRNEMSPTVCDGCGPVFVDADGWCLGDGGEARCRYRTKHAGEPGEYTCFHALHGPLMPCGCYTTDPACSLMHAVVITEWSKR